MKCFDSDHFSSRDGGALCGIVSYCRAEELLGLYVCLSWYFFDCGANSELITGR
jgi:hypothetical protein